MNRARELHALGQSIWLDYIQRDMIENGALAQHVADEIVRGVTSNPSIFEQAITGSDAYRRDLRMMAQAGWPAERILDRLVIDDIRAAADVLLRLYEATNGEDGYVSIEVNPELARDSEGTLREARRLWDAVNRPNVMVKIPATREGLPAIEAAVADGLNINVTLIFSLDRYGEVMEAYLRGLEARVQRGQALHHVASVASFFVSRVDTAVDARLQEIMRSEGPEAERAASLMGKAGIANAKLAYAQFKAVFEGVRFQRLAAQGARVQRPLWASTGTKNPAYGDTYYVDNLIGPQTVNTIPQHTLEAFLDHGRVELTLEQDLSASRAQLGALESLGIDMQEVTDRLEREGVEKFAHAYRSLLATIEAQAAALRRELGPLSQSVPEILGMLKERQVARRIWRRDASLWPASAGEAATERLGWLTLPDEALDRTPTLESIAAEIHAAGLDQIVLLGMGGSSLAAYVLASAQGRPELSVLDTSDPETIWEVQKRLEPERALFLAASKSGTTTETRALLDHFWAWMEEALGRSPGDHFIAITDAGTPLDALSRERAFREVLNPPSDVGGRYAALTEFGLMPAALLGLPLGEIAQGGAEMARRCGPQVEGPANPGLVLGACLAAAHDSGRDRLTFVGDPEIETFALWAEQLIAESSGKQGRGLTPVVAEPPGSAGAYGQDRTIVYLRSSGELDRRMGGWVKAGLPVIVMEMSPGGRDLGKAFFQWEFATAVACHWLGVNAFDQPDVQAAKDRTRTLLARFKKSGAVPLEPVIWEGEGIRLRGEAPKALSAESLDQAITWLLKEAGERRGLGLLAYLPERKSWMQEAKRLRRALRERSGIPVLFGVGPRYLHSTGQLHKGGPQQGAFAILTAGHSRDFQIPEAGYSFATLELAQAAGDLQALREAGRSAVHVELDSWRRASTFLRRMRQVAEQLSR